MEIMISEVELHIKEEIKTEPLDEVIKTVYDPMPIKQGNWVTVKTEDHEETEKRDKGSPKIPSIKKEEITGLGSIIYAIKDTGVECYNVSMVEPKSKPLLSGKDEDKKR